MRSPFKFLDAYDRQDKEIFFGRSEEIDQLYQLIFQTDLLLVYGQSGTGKTSLIQCGLANRFKSTDWFELFVRRKDDINLSLDREIRRRAKRLIKDEATVAQAIDSLYIDHLRPVYLIFDQFEELFVLGSEVEQKAFVQTVATLLEADLPCKIVLVMREEYIAMLHDFEKAVPRLFDKRFRVEPMSMRNVEQVIVRTTAAFGISLERGEDTARQIIANLRDPRAGVQLSYLQVYLDKVYRDAVQAQDAQPGERTPIVTPIVFTEERVRQTGALGDVMADFLEEQTATIQKDMKGRFPIIPDDAVQRILEEFATLEGTKQPMSREEIAGRLRAFNTIVDACLATFENSRIVRNADSVYELAHDSLAGRIADKRSGERKNLLKVRKLIKDRYLAFGQTHTYLSKEELGFINQYLGQVSLNAEETDFVAKSAHKVRRKRDQLLAMGGVLILALASLAAWAWHGEQRATKAIATARNFTNELSFSILDELKPIHGTTEVRRDLLRKVRGVNEELALDDEAAKEKPPFWANILEGDIELERIDHKNYAAARHAIQEALDTAARLNRRYPKDMDWHRNLSVAYTKLGELESQESEHGDLTKARAAFQRSLEIDLELSTRDPKNMEWQRDLAVSYGKLGDLDRRTGDAAKARLHYQDSQKLVMRLVALQQGSRDLKHDLSISYERLGDLDRHEGSESASASYDEARKLLEALTQSDPSNLAWRRDLGNIYWKLGDSAINLGQCTHARNWSDKAIAIGEALTRDNPFNLAWQHELSNYHRLRGEIEIDDKNLERAREASLAAVAIAEHLHEQQPNRMEWRHSLSRSYQVLGDFELSSGRLEAARKASAKALELAEHLHKASPKNVDWLHDIAVIHEQRGDIALQGRDFKGARAAYNMAIAIAKGNSKLHDLVERFENQLSVLDGKPSKPDIVACRS